MASILQYNPDFSNLQGKRNLIREIEGKITEKCYPRETKLVREIRGFEKPRVREIGIVLYFKLDVIFVHCNSLHAVTSVYACVTVLHLVPFLHFCIILCTKN